MSLSERERAVVDGLCSGKSFEEISKTLVRERALKNRPGHITARSVERVWYEIQEKLSAKNGLHAIAIYLRSKYETDSVSFGNRLHDALVDRLSASADRQQSNRRNG